MNIIGNSPSEGNGPYRDINTIFGKFIESEEREVYENFEDKLDELSREERYEQAMFIYFAEFSEVNEDKVQQLKNDISLIPEWEFLNQYQELLSQLEFMFDGLLRQARIELPNNIDDEDFIADKILEELLIGLKGFKRGVSNDDPELIVAAGNIVFNLTYSLVKYQNEEFNLDDFCLEILESSKRLKKLGLENEISQKMLSEFYNKDNVDIDQFRQRLRLERSFVIYKDESIELSVSRAAEMADFTHRAFLDEAKKYNIILKEA